MLDKKDDKIRECYSTALTTADVDGSELEMPSCKGNLC